MGGEVRLVDLDVVKRYSLAVQQETAPADEVLAALDSSRALVQAVIDATPAPAPRRARRATRKATA